jgi:glycosyltransferase involved in cell wall biosynthesis
MLPCPPGMPTVLYLNLYGTVGGAERALLELLAALDRRRYQPLVVLGADGPLFRLLRERDVEVVVEPFPALPLHRLLRPSVLRAEVRAARRLGRLAAARGVRLAHCGDVLSLLLLVPAARRGVRVVYQVNYLGGAPRRLALNVLALPLVDTLVAYSADQRAALWRGTVGLRGRTHVVHPGIEPRDMDGADGGGFRRELDLAPETPLVGLLARYDTWKGHHVYLQAAALVRGRRPDVRFCMVGGALNQDLLPHAARYREGVMDLRRRLGLEDVVQVVDHREDVPAVLAALDVMACPSEHEPFGMVVLESLAARRALVASDTGGPTEILEDGRSGLLFPTGDAAALAERVLRLLDDPGLRRRLGDAGRARVESAFHRDRYARDIEKIYDQLH